MDRYELDDVKAYFGVNGASKTELARLVSIQYNFLADSFERELRRKHPYAIRMFEAIAELPPIYRGHYKHRSIEFY